MEIADVIACHISQITALLSEPACRIIKPIVIDFNFIEVKPAGCCFNIAEKKFQLNPKDLHGYPRAFVLYEYNGEVPYPKPFVEGKNIYG